MQKRNSINLTKKFIETLPTPLEGQAFYRDAELKGFGIRVGNQKISYFVEMRINKKNVRKIFANYQHYSPEEARKEAKAILGKMSQGINPTDEKKKKEAATITLSEAFEDYMGARPMKSSTARHNRHLMNKTLKDWEDKSLNSISRDMIQQRHIGLTKKNGPIQANNALRLVSTIFNYAIAKYLDQHEEPLIKPNPVQVLSDIKIWNKKKRRQTLIQERDFPLWFKTICSLESLTQSNNAETVRDYLLLLLLTGLRKNEAASLQWSAINFNNRTMQIVRTKNGELLVLPLSDALLGLLARRKANTQSIFVFAGHGESGHLTETKRMLKIITEHSEIPFMLHDLRRNFLTAAANLCPLYAARRLMNHKISSNDVTDGYYVADVEKLRKEMQKITDYFLLVMQPECQLQKKIFAATNAA